MNIWSVHTKHDFHIKLLKQLFNLPHKLGKKIIISSPFYKRKPKFEMLSNLSKITQ